jgi:hypothetical protein
MGKRVPVDEKPFNPVEAALIRSVMAEEPPLPEPIVRRTPPSMGEIYLAKENEAQEPNGNTHLELLRREISPSPQRVPDGKLNREKRVLLTQPEERELERLVNLLAGELFTSVKLSHLLRACVTLLRHAENQIVDQARQTGPLTRPSNGDTVALADFEHRLARILSAAFRDAAQIR